MSPDTVALRRRIERMLRVAPVGLLAMTACELPSSTPTGRDLGHRPIAVGLGLPPPEAPHAVHAVHAQERAEEGQEADDHDAQEKARCPSGQWCAEPEVAHAFAVPTDPRSLGCPPRLVPNPENGIDPLDARYEGLSRSIDMRAELNRKDTLAERDVGATRCCYDWLEHCVGRPYVDLAMRAHAPGIAEGSVFDGSSARVRWAMSLVADASDERGSVASFSRLVLELLAVGAPSPLVDDAHRAALDELRHAEACLRLASTELGHRPRLGALPALAPRPGGVVALALRTLTEGCIGEAAAAIIGSRESQWAPTAQARGVLAEIAKDEASHAVASWRLLRWLSRSHGDLRAPLREGFERAMESLSEGGRDTRTKDVAPFRMSPAQRRAVVREVGVDVVLPCLEALG